MAGKTASRRGQARRLAYFFAALALFLTSSCRHAGEGAADSTEPLQRFEFTRPQMGLPFRMVLYAADRTKAEAGAEAAFARVAELNSILSDYDSDSELSQLSQSSDTQAVVRVSRDLWTVLAQAQELAAESRGAFDITVGPCVNLWRKARREQQLPRPDLLAETRDRVGWEKLRLNSRARTAQLLAPRMRLDLGAIAKGYAVDEALAVLRSRGLRCALVTAAGDMAAGAPPPGTRGWRIELAPLDAPGAPPALTVLLAHRALATSGDSFQRLEIDGRRYSHIVDPRTGVGLTDHSLVTVLAPDCLTADSLATAISVLGPREGLKLARRKPGVAARIVRRPGDTVEVQETPGFSKALSGVRISASLLTGCR